MTVRIAKNLGIDKILELSKEGNLRRNPRITIDFTWFCRNVINKFNSGLCDLRKWWFKNTTLINKQNSRPKR